MMFGSQKTVKISVEGQGVYVLPQEFRSAAFPFFRDADNALCTDKRAPYVYIKAKIHKTSQKISLSLEGRDVKTLSSFVTITKTAPFKAFDQLAQDKQIKNISLKDAFNTLMAWQQHCEKTRPHFAENHQTNKDLNLISHIKIHNMVGFYPDPKKNIPAKTLSRLKPQKLSL